MGVPDIALATAVHDPEGRLASAIERLAEPLRARFSAIALNLSDATPPDIARVAREALGATVIIHPAGEAHIGRIRRDAVRVALPAPTILYSDFDHMLRWVEHGADDLSAVLSERAEIEFLVIGRSAAALAAEPLRLQETERLVNHVHALITGETWDLMFAVRRMSRRAAETIVAQSTVDSLANDAEWPLLARRAGLSVGYAQSDALFYRTIEEFGAPADTRDGEALQWIRRIEFAALHAKAMREFLK